MRMCETLSFAKLSIFAIVMQALGQFEQANDDFDQALQLVKKVQQQDKGNGAVSEKCESLLGFLKSRQQ